MTETIHAPWTTEQVDALNRFQREGGMHPFTCGGDHTPGSPILVAREDGWHCPEPYGEPCDYRQDWAHAFMADPAAWPKQPFGGRHGPTPGEMRRMLDVQGRCPACNWQSLFLGNGGHVTCSRLECPNPCAADQLLHGEPGPAATQATEEQP